jgi:hypothetical protein
VRAAIKKKNIMKKKEFKVLLMDFNRKKYEAYDVLPYFRNIWRGHRFNWDKDYNKIPVKTKEQLKEWIIDWARYQFWARCEYEFLMASWPFGSHSMTEEMKEFLKTNPDIDNYDDDLRFCNIIIRDMVKIDVYEQLMMNIDILVDILNDEFLMKNKK